MNKQAATKTGHASLIIGRSEAKIVFRHNGMHVFASHLHLNESRIYDLIVILSFAIHSYHRRCHVDIGNLRAGVGLNAESGEDAEVT